MPAKVKVRILAGRNLPVMDKSSDASDAFVEVKLGNTTYKTEVYRRSLNPFWNSEWFRFEVSDQELQDEPLQIRIMDYDTYSANDAIGKVYINLNPLLLNPNRSMNGWLPIYDTLHGIRGEINCMVKVNLFADNNRFRHSSCGVRFFFSDIPMGYKCDAILGFVDELLVNDDPEYQWIDKIRTPRASNEARQTLFTKLSGEVQRKLGLKAEIFGGNAVIGYQQSFDLEGGSGIVGRGIGTAVVLSKIGQDNCTGSLLLSPLSLGSHQQHYNPYHNIPSNNSSSMTTRHGPNQRLHYSLHNQKSAQPTNTERHLVHSVSADYFYEVPLKVLHKKLSTTHDSTRLFGKQMSNDSSKMNSFISLQSTDEEDNDDDDDEDDDDDTGSDINTSSFRPSSSVLLKKANRRAGLKKSLSFMQVPSKINRVSTLPPDVEAKYRLVSKFFETNKYITQKFLSLTGRQEKQAQQLQSSSSPLSSSSNKTNPGALKLLKLLSNQTRTNNSTNFRNNNRSPGRRALESDNVAMIKTDDVSQTNNNSNNNKAKATGLASIQAKQQYFSLPQASLSQSTDDSQPTIQPVKESTCLGSKQRISNKDNESQKEVSATNPIGIKTTADATLVASSTLDDALSIIEEKLDDDADNLGTISNTLQSHTNEQKVVEQNKSPPIGQSGRMKQFTRTKEIDLSDMSEQFGEPSFSSVDEFEVIEPGTSIKSIDTHVSSMTTPFNKSSPTCSESLVSTSSPSSSLLTDETIKAAKSANDKHSGIEHLAAPKISASMRRSDTDLRAHDCQASMMSNKQVAVQNNNFNLSRSERDTSRHAVDDLIPFKMPSKPRAISSSPRPRPASSSSQHVQQPQQQQQQNQNLSQTHKRNNFASSVGVIKAQQHLLQNMIKQQNQNLLVSSMSKARNALIYPGRINQSEFPFVTLKRYPDSLIQCTGGVVSVHSVKLLDHIINDDESETRDNWWNEIRKEIRSHAKSLNCNTILGYTETSKVLGDVCILSARGTASVLRSLEHVPLTTNAGQHSLPLSSGRERTYSAGYQQASANLKVPRLSASPPLRQQQQQQQQVHTSNLMPGQSSILATTKGSSDLMRLNTSQSAERSLGDLHDSSVELHDDRDMLRARSKSYTTLGDSSTGLIDCSFCHTPLHCVESISSLADCSICCSSKVPDVLLLTIEPPKNLNIASTCCLVQARVCRAKRDSHGEASAKEIGDALPFLEYELHRQLFSKLKFKGLNCLFNLSIDISVGENFLTGIATGTGCFVLGLPVPGAPQISAGKGIKASKLDEIQRLISLSAMKNREYLGLNKISNKLNEYHKQIGINTPLELLSDQQELVVGDNVETKDIVSCEHKDCLEDISKEDCNSSVLVADLQDLTTSQQNASTSAYEADTEDKYVKRTKLSPHELIIESADSRRSLQSSTATGSRHKLTSTTASHHHHRHHHHHNHHHHQHHHHHHHHQRASKSSSQNVRALKGGESSRSEEAVVQPIYDTSLVSMLGDENNIVLEVDDNEDADIIALLIDSDVPNGYTVCTSEVVPTIDQNSIASINMFTQVTRVKLANTEQFAQQFDLILQTLYVKLRRSLPCCLTNMNFVVDLPESNVVQISITGCLLTLKPAINQLQEQEMHHLLSSDLVATKNNESREGRRCVAHTTTTSSATMSPSSHCSTTTPESGSNSAAKASNQSSSASPKATSSSSTTSSSESSSSSSSSDSSSSSSHMSLVENELQKNAVASTTKSTTTSNKLTLIKNTSKNNLVALLNAGKSTLSIGERKSKKQTASSAELVGAQKDGIEMSDVSGKRTTKGTSATPIATSPSSECSTPTTQATIAAVKHEILQNRLGGGGATVESETQTKTPTSSKDRFKTVFKKQQTYPGANSPLISGQDNILAVVERESVGSHLVDGPSTSGGGTTNNATTSGVTTNAAARKASALLNRVKQPFKDLGSNFNQTTSNTYHGTQPNHSKQPARSNSMNVMLSPNERSISESLTSKRGGSKFNSTSNGRNKQSKGLTISRPASLQVTSSTTMNGSSTSGGPYVVLPPPLTLQQQQAIATSSTTTCGSQQGLSSSPAGLVSALKSTSRGRNDSQTVTAYNSNAPTPPHPISVTLALGGDSRYTSLNSNIDITSLSYVPGARDYHYLGNLSFSFVRETNSVRENGGLNGFIHCSLMEVYAIVRAHVSALGGNALLSFRLQQSCIFYHSNKNQAQCLISVAGDAVQVTMS